MRLHQPSIKATKKLFRVIKSIIRQLCTQEAVCVAVFLLFKCNNGHVSYRLESHKRSGNQANVQSRTTVKKRQQQETDAVCLMVVYDCTPPTGLDPPHRVVDGPRQGRRRPPLRNKVLSWLAHVGGRWDTLALIRA